MGWYGEQTYYMSVDSEQAAALVLMAESYFGRPGGVSRSGCECRIFGGTYRTVRETWLAEITGGQRLVDAGYPSRIVLTPGGPRTMQQLIEVAPGVLPTQSLVGIVYPYIYRGDYDVLHPVSFVFAREVARREKDKSWRLVSAVPFVANWSGPEWPGHGRDDLSDRLWDAGELRDIGKSFWPEAQVIPPTTVVGTRDGCYIELRKQYPSTVTAFIHFAQHQLHIDCDSVPNVDTTVTNDFRPDWELDFDADLCFDASPERVAYWRHAFGLDAPDKASA